MKTKESTRKRYAARSQRDAILASKNTFWRASDLASKLSESTAQHLLASLVDSGDLRHVRRGLYWRGVKTPLGMPLPSPDALAAELAPGSGVGPAGLSAANSLRLSTQIPRRSEFAVTSRAPEAVGAVKFVSRSSRTGRKRSRLNSTEVAALEVLDSWDRVIETSPADAMKRLGEIIRSGAVRPERLVSASATEPAKARVRLQALLKEAGRSDLADRVPAADRRATSAALKTLVSA